MRVSHCGCDSSKIYILKAKINFTLFICIPFCGYLLGIYQKGLFPIKVRSIAHKAFGFRFLLSKMQPQGPYETCKGSK